MNRKNGEADAASFDRAMFALGLDLHAATAPKAEAPAAITALAEKRWAAKQAKDFATADALRKELAAAGWSMLDRKDGYSQTRLKQDPPLKQAALTPGQSLSPISLSALHS